MVRTISAFKQVYPVSICILEEGNTKDGNRNFYQRWKWKRSVLDVQRHGVHTLLFYYLESFLFYCLPSPNQASPALLDFRLLVALGCWRWLAQCVEIFQFGKSIFFHWSLGQKHAQKKAAKTFSNLHNLT